MAATAKPIINGPRFDFTAVLRRSQCLVHSVFNPLGNEVTPVRGDLSAEAGDLPSPPRSPGRAKLRSSREWQQAYGGLGADRRANACLHSRLQPSVSSW